MDNQKKGHKGLFWDSDAQASFQGNMRVNYFQWIKMNPSKTLKIIGILVISFLLAYKVHWFFWIIFAGALLYNLWYWFMVYNRFKGGNVQPGKVLSLEPDLVAVTTDLTKMMGTFPIIKIIKTNLPRQDKVVGKIIPTVAIYNDNPHGYPFWSEFHPVPVIHGISNRKHLDYLNSKFTKADVLEIENALNQVAAITPGTYKIDAEHSGWKDFPHVDINLGVNMQGPKKTPN